MSVIIDNSGIKAQDTDIILEEYRGIFRRIFGDSVDLTLQGLNGQIINELVLREVDNDSKMLQLFNGYNIETSEGIFLDYIAKLFGVTRREATPTIVSVRFLGLTGTVIPIGFKVQDENGNIYVTRTQEVIFNGIAIIDCYCEILGAIEVESGTIGFYDNLSGLDSVENDVDGITGSNTETDLELRLRTIQTRALNSAGVIDSLFSAISEISKNFSIVHNNTLSDIVVDSNITVPPHTILLCIFGGGDQEIADALYRKNSSGVAMVGDVVVELSTPFNSIFEAKFQRPDLVELEISVNLKSDPKQIGDVVNLSKNTIKKYFDEINIIGNSFFASEFIAELDKVGVIKIESLLINIKTGTPETSVDLTKVQLGSLSINDITVVEV